jgi:hypothetical protein
MVQIATVLLGLSAAIVAFVLREPVESGRFVDAFAAGYLSAVGIMVSGACVLITLVYGGYANRNWAKADQLAQDYGWRRLDPEDSPFPPRDEEPGQASWLVAWALRQSEPRPTHKKLAPCSGGYSGYRWSRWLLIWRF